MHEGHESAVFPSGFTRLWSLARELTPAGKNPAAIFDCSGVGLILEARLCRAGNSSTPINSLTFAHTGGDGVHFGFLMLAERMPDEMPVVMTVPMSDIGNIVVGENFLEFLRLGCRNGYFSLEQLAYDPTEWIERIQGQSVFTSEDTDGLLRAISERFGLEPWRSVGDRLAELQSMYGPRIELESV